MAEAVRVTVATAGRAVFFCGLTVLLGLLGLVLFEFMILRSVGIAGAIVVGLAVAAALTLLPAILAILGTRIDRLSVRKVTVEPGADGPWARLARRVMRHPVAVLVPTLSILLLLGSPSSTSGSTPRTPRSCPPSVPSREAFDVLAREFGEGEFAPLVIAVRTTGDATTPENVAALYDYSRRLAADPRISRVDEPRGRRPAPDARAVPAAVRRPGWPARPIRRRDPGGDDPGRPDRLHRHHAVRPQPRRGAGARARPARPRGPARPAGRRARPGRRRGRRRRRRGPRVGADFPRTAAFIIVTTYLVLFVLLRSVVLPIKALVMNTLSIVASFGALVWIFQDGNLSALLGLPAARVRRDHPSP